MDTVLLYDEGGSSKDYVKTRTFLWNDEQTFIKLINKLSNGALIFRISIFIRASVLISLILGLV